MEVTRAGNSSPPPGQTHNGVHIRQMGAVDRIFVIVDFTGKQVRDHKGDRQKNTRANPQPDCRLRQLSKPARPSIPLATLRRQSSIPFMWMTVLTLHPLDLLF